MLYSKHKKHFQMKNILIVDDHPIILDAYENLLKDTSAFKIENLFKATSIEKAISYMEEKRIDIAFFDISLPKSTLYNFDDGIDLALYFKTKYPLAKIVFITGYMEFYILLKAIHLAKPDAFISKSDIEPDTFSSILEFIKNDKLFYSEQMLAILKWAKQSQIKLDIYDFKILSLTNKGVKTKELINHLPLSLRAIEKKKIQPKINNS